jgi:hypothetical protein
MWGGNQLYCIWLQEIIISTAASHDNDNHYKSRFARHKVQGIALLNTITKLRSLKRDLLHAFQCCETGMRVTRTWLEGFRNSGGPGLYQTFFVFLLSFLVREEKL